jgi:hypothetical protein
MPNVGSQKVARSGVRGSRNVSGDTIAEDGRDRVATWQMDYSPCGARLDLTVRVKICFGTSRLLFQ